MARKPPERKAGLIPPGEMALWRAVGDTVDPILKRKSPDPRRLLDPERSALEPTGLPVPRFAPTFRPSSQPVIAAASRPLREKPLEPNLRRRVQRGHLPIDATLDLHGMTQVQARDALVRFIPARARRGDRTVLVITGKGLKKTGYLQIEQKGILRTMLPLWLAQADLAPLIAGFEPAHQDHGGEGAFYIRLKRIRT